MKKKTLTKKKSMTLGMAPTFKLRSENTHAHLFNVVSSLFAVWVQSRRLLFELGTADARLSGDSTR